MKRRDAIKALAVMSSAAALPARLLASDSDPAAKLPGTVIFHSPARTGKYVGSPGIAALPDQSYLAKCDLFGPESDEFSAPVTLVFRSEDRGKTWRQVAEKKALFWASIFSHRGRVYMLGTDHNLSRTVITASDYNGITWSCPRDENTGILLRGRNHTAPVPVVEYNGRLFRAMESIDWPHVSRLWCKTFMMSAANDTDLLLADSWTCSNRILGNGAWLNGRFRGWLEGNAVLTPAGEIVNILRVQEFETGDYAALIKLSDDGRKAGFDPQSGFVNFPGGAKKFTIRFDPQSSLYWSLSNVIPESQRGGNPGSTRNTMALVHSPDLVTWKIGRTVLSHPDRVKHAFQYLDWLFEGEDLIAVSRTAYDDRLGGAHNAHDANYLTFHRIKNFRGLG